MTTSEKATSFSVSDQRKGRTVRVPLCVGTA